MWERLCLAGSRYPKALQELAQMEALRRRVGMQWGLPELCQPHTLRRQGWQTPFFPASSAMSNVWPHLPPTPAS